MKSILIPSVLVPFSVLGGGGGGGESGGAPCFLGHCHGTLYPFIGTLKCATFIGYTRQTSWSRRILLSTNKESKQRENRRFHGILRSA